MARIRTIKPEFWTSEQVMACSPLARLLFIGMWNFADDLGRLSLSAKTIKAQIFPADEFCSETILGMVAELAANGLVLIYTAENGRDYLQITGWQHQRIDKPQPGKHPGPTKGFSKTIPGTVAECSPTERKGEERILEEGILNDLSGPVADAPRRCESDLFEEFWKAFPKRDGSNPPKPAEEQFRKLVKAGVDPQRLIRAAQQFASAQAGRSKAEARFIPKAVTWLAEERWNEPSAVELAQEPAQVDFAKTVSFYAKTGHWSRWAGPAPGERGCKVPPELLAAYGIGADGRRMATA